MDSETPEQYNRRKYQDLMDRLDHLADDGIIPAEVTAEIVKELYPDTMAEAANQRIVIVEGASTGVRIERLLRACGFTTIVNAEREGDRMDSVRIDPIYYVLKREITPEPDVPLALLDRPRTHPVSYRDSRRKTRRK